MVERPLNLGANVPLAQLVAGYRVMTLDGKEVGLVSSVNSGPPERAIIRLKRLFGKRQALSLSLVAAVNSEDGIVVLGIGSRAFDQLVHEDKPVKPTSVQDLPAVDRDAEPLELSATEEGSAGVAGGEPALGDHLLFVATSAGYMLCQGDGALPNAGHELESANLPEGRFLVAKVARSPLPLDRRRCAYLHPLH